MQPNATRPVMDVAKRSYMPPVRTAVRPAPPSASIDAQPAVKTQQPNKVETSKPSSSTAAISQKKISPEVAPQTKPVGVIVAALLVMMVLISLVVIIYLTSQG